MELAVPVVLALALGAWGIQRGGSMWRDEAVTMGVAGRSLSDLWALVQHVDAVHGLYYLVMHYWLSAWPWDALVGLRLPSVLATGLAACGVGAIGRHLGSRRAGLFAGACYAILPMTQHYAQEGRPYALVSACIIWASWLLLRAMESNRRTTWSAYAALVVVAGWLNLFAVLAVVAHGVCLWWERAPRIAFRAFAVAALSVLVGILPLAILAVGQADDQLGWLSRPGLGQWASFIAVAVAGVILSRATLLKRSSIGVHRLGLTLLVLPPGLLLLVSMVKPYYVDRYVLYSLSGLALLMGSAADRALRPETLRKAFPRSATRWAVVTVISAVVVTMLLPWHINMRSPDARKDDALAVSAAVRKISNPGDAVLFSPARRRDWLLHDTSTYHPLQDIAMRVSPKESGTLRGIESSPAGITKQVSKARRVVVLSDPPGQPLDQTPQELAKRRALKRYFMQCRTLQVRGAQVSLWAHDCTSSP